MKKVLTFILTFVLGLITVYAADPCKDIKNTTQLADCKKEKLMCVQQNMNRNDSNAKCVNECLGATYTYDCLVCLNNACEIGAAISEATKMPPVDCSNIKSYEALYSCAKTEQLKECYMTNFNSTMCSSKCYVDRNSNECLGCLESVCYSSSTGSTSFKCADTATYAGIYKCAPDSIKLCMDDAKKTSCNTTYTCLSGDSSEGCLGCIKSQCNFTVISDPSGDNPDPDPVPVPGKDKKCEAADDCYNCKTLDEKLECMKGANKVCTEVERKRNCSSVCTGSVPESVCQTCLKANCGTGESSKSQDDEMNGAWNFCDKHGVLVSMNVLNKTIRLAMVIVPLLLIAFGAIDLFKAITSSNQDALNIAIASLVKKIIIGLCVFFVPIIIKSCFGLLSDYSSVKNNNCYACLFDEKNSNKKSCRYLINHSNDK